MKLSNHIPRLRVVPLALAVIGLLIPVGVARLCRCTTPLAEKGCCGGPQGAERGHRVAYCSENPCCDCCRIPASQPTFTPTDRNTTDWSIWTVGVNGQVPVQPENKINGLVENCAESRFGSFLRLHALLGVWLN